MCSSTMAALVWALLVSLALLSSLTLLSSSFLLWLSSARQPGVRLVGRARVVCGARGVWNSHARRGGELRLGGQGFGVVRCLFFGTVSI